MNIFKTTFFIACFFSIYIGLSNVYSRGNNAYEYVTAEIKVDTIANDSLSIFQCSDRINNVELPSSGYISIWAIDFVAFEFDTCGPLDFRIWYNYMDSSNYPDQSVDWGLPNDTMTGDDVLSSLPDAAVFYCETMTCLTYRLFNVRVYAVSQCGYWEYCESTVEIRNDDDVCPTNCGLEISGDVTNCLGENVDDVFIEIAGGLNNQTVRTQIVDEDGEFKFIVGRNYDWCVTAQKDDAYLNGVSAQDLSLLLRHITGIELLDSPYKKVAGDLNADHQIDVRDMLLLRKLLLGIIPILDDVESWVMIDAAYDFPGITDNVIPHFPTQICKSNIVEDWLDANFVAVKMGDLECNAIANSSGNGPPLFNAQPFRINVENRSVIAEEIIEVILTSANFVNMTGFQGTLTYDTDFMEVLDVQSAAVKVWTNEESEMQGQIPMLWASATPVTFESNETLIKLKIRAKKSGELNDFFRFSSTITETKAFSALNERHDLILEFVDKFNTAIEFTLFQNTPNPVYEQTAIRFNLPIEQTYELHFYNIQGQFLNSIEGLGLKGANQIELNKNTLSPTSGLIYYQLVTEDFKASGKMLVQ